MMNGLLQFRATAHFLLIVAAAAASAQQKRDAPQAGQTNDGIDDPAQQSVLTAKQPGYQIELKNTYQTPVCAADDRQDQCQSVKHGLPSNLKC